MQAQFLIKTQFLKMKHKEKRLQTITVNRATSDTLSVFSPSKINLFLRIIRRREDGYHDLASLFHVIDLGDAMSFAPIDSDQDLLTCNIPDIPTDDSNLVVKALNLYRNKTGLKQYFKVSLEKVVPHGAGLGGGSANAATTLWAANQISGNVASDSDLLTWSGEIGSDISVFFSNGAAYCTGRGEIVENVEPPIALSTPMLLVKPLDGLSTPAIFKALDLGTLSDRDPLELLETMRSVQTVTPELCVNDLEPPAFTILPELQILKKRLQNEGDFESVFMTGSGSTIVCFGSDNIPEFLKEEQYKTLFISPARLIARKPTEWSMGEAWKNAKDIDGKQHYRTLGLKYGAKDAEIRHAYRQLARQLHPDKGGDSASFALLREAFEVLTDPQRRSVYDRWASQVDFRYFQGVADRVSGGEDILLNTYERNGIKCDPRTQLIVTCEVCRRPATKECWICKMQICDFCTLKQHWKDSHPLHWPLVDSQEFRVRLAKAEMQKKIQEDAKNYFMQDPNYRSQEELEVIRSFKLLTNELYAKTNFERHYDHRLGKFYLWTDTEDLVVLVVFAPTGYKDRPLNIECDGRRLRLQSQSSNPVIDRLLDIPLTSNSVEVASSADNRYHVLKLPKALPGEAYKCLFVGDSDGCRIMQPLYDSFDVDDEFLIELRVPFWIDSDDVYVKFTQTDVEIQVRNLFHIRRCYWTELEFLQEDKIKLPMAVELEKCSWTLDNETVVHGSRGKTLSVSLVRPDPTPSDIEWKKGIRQDNKMQKVVGRQQLGIRFFADDEDVFNLEPLLQAAIFHQQGRVFIRAKPWLANQSSYWAMSKQSLPDAVQRLLTQFYDTDRSTDF